jgi:C_GCAxxG_C_C family probable redox protein
VLLAVCQHYGIETDDRSIPRIASGFGGGLGNTGAVCGAVVGAVMGIGLRMDRGDTMEEMLRSLEVVADLRRRFEAELGSIHCRELTGADLTTEEGIEQYMASVGTAYRLAVEILDGST